MIKVIFVDVDDTLLSFSGYVKEAMEKGFRKFGLKPYTPGMYPVFERINTGLWQSIERGGMTLPQLEKVRWNKIFSALGIDFDGPTFERYFRRQLFDSAVIVPGAVEMLEYLHARYTLVAASNGPYGQQMHRLEIAGMKPYFAHCFISEQVGTDKPGRAFFDFCFRTLHESGFPDLAPDETMIIGDSLTSDIAGGRAYGMHTCLFDENGKKANGGDLPADVVIRRLTDIRTVL